ISGRVWWTVRRMSENSGSRKAGCPDGTLALRRIHRLAATPRFWLEARSSQNEFGEGASYLRSRRLPSRPDSSCRVAPARGPLLVVPGFPRRATLAPQTGFGQTAEQRQLSTKHPRLA